MLRHPCILRGHECQARGPQSEVFASLSPSRGPKEGGNAMSPVHCRGSPAQTRGAKSEVVPNKRKQNQKWLPHPCILGAQKEGGNTMSPVHSRGSRTPSARSKIRSGLQQRGTKSEVVASPLPSWGPKRGWKCYGTRAFSGSPTPSTRSEIISRPQQKRTKLEVAASPVPSQGPKRGRKRYVTPSFLGIPNAKRTKQNQIWFPTKGNKIRIFCVTPAFSRAHKRAKMLCHPCILGGTKCQAPGAKCEVAASPLPSRVTIAFPRIPGAKHGDENQKWSPTKGNKIRSGCPNPAFSGARKRAETLCYPCILGDSQQMRTRCELAASTLYSRAQGMAEMLLQSRILGGPQQRETKLEVVVSSVHSQGSPLPSTWSEIRSGPQQSRLK